MNMSANYPEHLLPLWEGVRACVCVCWWKFVLFADLCVAFCSLPTIVDTHRYIQHDEEHHLLFSMDFKEITAFPQSNFCSSVACRVLKTLVSPDPLPYISSQESAFRTVLKASHCDVLVWTATVENHGIKLPAPSDNLMFVCEHVTFQFKVITLITTNFYKKEKLKCSSTWSGCYAPALSAASLCSSQFCSSFI